MDLDDGFELVPDVDAAAAFAAAAAAAAAVEELRLSTALLVMDRLRVTRPPAVLPKEAGDALLLASALLLGVTGVVGNAPPSLETPDRLDPLESWPESQEE